MRVPLAKPRPSDSLSAMIRASIAALLLLALPQPAAASDPIEDAVRAKLAEAGPGTRFGLVVVDDQGREIVAIAPDDRFVPASNTKLYSTALAYETLSVDGPDAAGGTQVRLGEGPRPDVILIGRGDPRLSGAADCTVDCLSTLADAVAARTRVVGDVIGDDSFFPDERWPSGMSWNNMTSRYGTAISALSIDDNEWRVTVTPGAVGDAARIDGDGYESIDNHVTTGLETDLATMRMPGSGRLRVWGTIAQGAAPETVRVGIEDPAHRAAWLMRRMLESRGVRVTGDVGTRHRAISPSDDPARGGPAPRVPEQPSLATLSPPPLSDTLTITNKVSQNLYADLLLRRASAVTGSGSVADGQAAVQAMLTRAGVARHQYDFSDGSGMSTYNRLSPRGTVTFLRWTQTRPWGAAFRETLPIAGKDGTLSRRFIGTPLEGRLFAKTGSLNASNTLAGFISAKSGRTLTFASFANDMPQDKSVRDTVDAALILIAEAY